MDDADYVHDEIPIKLWCQFQQFHRFDRIIDTVYHIHHYSVCDIYRGDLCV